MERELNWHGWSIETFAAVYETDSATEELERGEVDQNYWQAACAVEFAEVEIDRSRENVNNQPYWQAIR